MVIEGLGIEGSVGFWGVSIGLRDFEVWSSGVELAGGGGLGILGVSLALMAAWKLQGFSLLPCFNLQQPQSDLLLVVPACMIQFLIRVLE